MDHDLLLNGICIAIATIFGFLYIWETVKFIKAMDEVDEADIDLRVRLLTLLLIGAFIALFLGGVGLYRDGIQLGFFGFMAGLLVGFAPFMLGVLSEAE